MKRVLPVHRLGLVVPIVAAIMLPTRAESAVLAYIPNQSGATVSVVDISTGAVVTTIPVGQAPIGVAVAPDHRHVYVTAHSGGTVAVIATISGAVLAEIPVGSQPMGVAVSPNGARLYVSNFLTAGASGGGSMWVNGTLTVVDTVTRNALFSIFVGANPSGVAVSPDGSRVYVANAGSGTLSVVSTLTNVVIATIPVGANPIGVAASPDGQHVYVANSGSASVSVIDTTALVETSSIRVGGHAMGIAVSDDSTRIVVSNTFDNSVAVIDAATLAVTTTTAGIGPAPSGVAFAPLSRAAFVANASGGTLSAVDADFSFASTITYPTLGWPVSLGRFVVEQPGFLFGDGFE